MEVGTVTRAGTDVKVTNNVSRQEQEQGEAQQVQNKDQTDKTRTANELNQVGTNVNVTT